MRLIVKYRPYSRRKLRYSMPESQSSLFTMSASVGPSPNVMNFSKTCEIPAMFSSIFSWVISTRDASLPDGSPTLVVPPPTSTTGLCPHRW